MSQRTEKVESLIQQVVAGQIPILIGPDAASVTVTGVDAAPDLRNATVWLGIVGTRRDPDGTKMYARVIEELPAIQRRLAQTMTMKYAPKLHFKSDAGGAYAAHIQSLMRDI